LSEWSPLLSLEYLLFSVGLVAGLVMVVGSPFFSKDNSVGTPLFVISTE
jgi:hypothetical protein